MKFLLASLLLFTVLGGVVLLAERERLSAALEREAASRAQAEEAIRGLEERLGTARLESARLTQEIRFDNDQAEARERFLAEVERRLGRPESPETEPLASTEERTRAQAMLSLIRGLNRLLIASGHGRVRFMAIERLEGQALLDVSLTYLGPDGLVAHALRAERLYLVLDSGARELRLISPRGRELVGGEWVDFGPEGWELVLGGLDPKPWKSFALAPIEVLPEPPVVPTLERPLLERADQLAWLARFTQLLQGMTGLSGRQYRVVAIESLSPSGFQGVTVLGYTPRGLLCERFEARRMAVEALSEGGVRLVLQEGFHADEMGRRDLPQAGYLLYLPGADRADWARSLGVRLIGRARENP